MSDLLEQELPGWRPDPSGRYEWRYWDGGWTNRVANSARPAPEAATPTDAAADGPGVATTDDPVEPSPGASTVRPVAVEPRVAPTDEPPAPTASPSPTAAPVLQVPPVPPSPTPRAAAAASSSVFTFPTSHDGSSGTIYDGPYVPDQPAGTRPTATDDARRKGVFAAIGRFFRSFSEEEESY